MNSEQLKEHIFTALLQCYIELKKYIEHQNVSSYAKRDAILLQRAIEKILAKKENLDLEDIDACKKRFLDSDLSLEHLLESISKVTSKLNDFSIKYDPSTWETITTFISGIFFERNDTSAPPQISVKLNQEIAVLTNLQHEFKEHIKELKFLDKKEAADHADTFLSQTGEETDASRLVEEIALPHVQEYLDIQFNTLFEYAYCLQIIKDKIPENLNDYKVLSFIDKVQGEILKEIGVTVKELKAIHSDQELFLKKKQEYISRKTPKDCLNIAKIFESKDHIRKNMDRLFIELDKNGVGNNVVIKSFENGYKGCEKNIDLMKLALTNLSFIRDQAKNIKEDLKKYRLGKKILDKLLILLGIKDLVKQNFIQFSYKELSDLARVRLSLESQELEAKPAQVKKLGRYNFSVNAGERKDFSYGRQKYQEENLTKYATFCGMQMQVAEILLENIKSEDKKLQKYLLELSGIVAEIKEQLNPESENSYRYKEITHRRLHELLNMICNDFYPNIEQYALHILINAGNIQREIDYKIFANDIGGALVTNTSLYSYGDTWEDTSYLSSIPQKAKAKATGSLEWGEFGATATVSRNATRLFVGSNTELSHEIEEFNGLAQQLSTTMPSDETFSSGIQDRDAVMFNITSRTSKKSYVSRFIIFCREMIALFTIYLVAPFKSRLSTQANEESKDRARSLSTDSSTDSKKDDTANIFKQIMRVQLEQQAKILVKSLDLAEAINPDLAKPISRIENAFFRGSRKDKTIYKVLALQQAVKTIADEDLRKYLFETLEVNKFPLNESTEKQRIEYIRKATRILAEYHDYIKIDDFYTHCVEKIENEIGSVIDKQELSVDQISARETMKWLLATPVTLEMTKAIFLSPFVRQLLDKFSSNLIFKLAETAMYLKGVAEKYLQEPLFALKLIKHKKTEITGSPTKVAEFYVYEYGKLRVDLETADRLIHSLESPQKAKTKVMSAVATQKTYTNPYTRKPQTFLASMQESAAWQMVELLNVVVEFSKHVAGNQYKDVFVELVQHLNMLTSIDAQKSDHVRNKAILEALDSLQKLTADYNLQKDPKCFEFLMLIRYAAENVESNSKFAIKAKEYISLHAVSDVSLNDRNFMQKISERLNIGGNLYQKILSLASGGSIKALNKALQQLPYDLSLEIPHKNIKKKKSMF